jgi:hypothetical protein
MAGIFAQKPKRPLRYPARVTNSLIHATRQRRAIPQWDLLGRKPSLKSGLLVRILMRFVGETVLD